MVTYEINRRLLKEHFNGDTQAAIQAGYCVIWTDERIKAAFAFGQGTRDHFIVYMNANKGQQYYYSIG